ncbi:MAG TPA: type I methionyl aminopeptidase [Patescibacteria group bacterium]|uniref:Methionine aminopeptidase n=1 Tax=Candidatus Woesebacteria bacterium RBG_13_46_13 TaxID=1802479 RepID=A0A1F7X5L6_9BACT|nr:MAG: type I methionyl aminopeptidase [Candidatus Woesebacteria bacterium RBG_13_46_13]HJX59146.1 type I methionyl aminopeptidase [Patescibacteria group bacterium]
MTDISLKTKEEVAIMQEGGVLLGKVKAALKEKVQEGVNASEVEDLAVELIKKSGGEASFKMVPGYSWATCININEGLVHGIPKESVVFKKGDVVSVDVGLYYKGFHTDTSFTKAIEPDSMTKKFLQAGQEALEKAIEAVSPGKRIYDISLAIQETIEKAGHSPIRVLTGHGVGRELHEEPKITCFASGDRAKSPEITEGMVLAIEVMYCLGSPQVEISKDGWTISMRDGKISALFEETVAVTSRGPLVLTEG